jgi:transcriptional repressor NrdR
VTPMINVKKRDGRKEVFIPEKIVVSAVKTGATPEIARVVSQEISKGIQDGATTQEIKVQVLTRLKAKNPEWERNWTIYDTAVKKRQA